MYEHLVPQEASHGASKESAEQMTRLRNGEKLGTLFGPPVQAAAIRANATISFAEAIPLQHELMHVCTKKKQKEYITGASLIIPILT